MFRTGLVAKTQPAAIRIYDYYEPGNLPVLRFYTPELILWFILLFFFDLFVIFEIRFCSQPSDQVLPIPATEEFQHL